MSLFKFKMRGKLLSLVLASCLVPIILSGGIGYWVAQNSLKAQKFNQLTSVRDIKRLQIEDYFRVIGDQVVTLASNPSTVDATAQFIDAFDKIETEAKPTAQDLTAYRAKMSDYYHNLFGEEYKNRNDGKSVAVESLIPNSGAPLILQHAYIGANANGLGEKHNLTRAPESLTYNKVHETYHPFFRSFLDKFGYYDVFLVDAKTGHIIYSVFKETDYATSLRTGPYKTTGIADAFLKSAEGKQVLNDYEDKFSLKPNFIDFKTYLPSYDGGASFVSAPVYKDKKLIGVLIFQMPLDRINAIMQERTGLGETGESYIVGADKLMRSQSHFVENSILHQKVDTHATTQALVKKTGQDTIKSYNDQSVMAAYTPTTPGGMAWALVVEQEKSEALAATSIMAKWFIGLGIAIALVMMLIGFFYAARMVKPIRRASFLAGEITQGKFDLDIDTSREDEIGDLLRDLDTMQIRLKDDIQGERRQKEIEMARVKLSLDNANQMTMIADKEYNIVYFNAKLESFFQEYGMAIKQDVPGFDKDKIMGTNIDVFHKNPAHQRGVLDSLTSTKQVELHLAGLTLELQVTPVVDAEGKRIGTVVCWEDVTSQRQAEKELDEVVGAAANGDLTKQMNVDAYEGAIAQIGKGLNQVISVNRNVIEELNEVFGRLVEGDLTRSVTGEYAGTFHELKANANNTISKLKEVMGSIADSSETVGNAANEIALGNADLSQRTEEQASSLEETSATMTDLSQRTKDGVQQMTEAATMADDTKLKAEEGGEVVGRVVEAMNEIQTSSKKINDIIGVIDEIAFQTNLLALNAAVEAARAGEQGRGFAVVAAEVRTLAQRSATAAKEIKDLIGDSVGKVDDGARLVSESGEALQAIIENVEGVAKVITELSESSRQQAASIGEVNESVSQMDTMTQQNAALVEESYAASNLMQEQAKSLLAEIGFFNIGEQGQSKPKSVPQAPAKPAAKPASPAMPKADNSNNNEDWESF